MYTEDIHGNKIEEMLGGEWFTLGTLEGEGWLYINPESFDYEPGVDRYTFSTLQEAIDFRDELDCPEGIVIIREKFSVLDL